MNDQTGLVLDAARNVAAAEAAGLRYAHEGDPGIRRRRVGKGFGYRDAMGTVIRDKAILERIRKLAIPPAYTDVWICPDPLGHIQATGRDAKGRKQYRYHERWRNTRDEAKFSRMAAFGRALPSLRARVESDLRRQALTHEKVVATVVRLLELTLIRVGNDEYAKQNNSFGLTTLHNRHVTIDGRTVTFAFRGKSGVVRQLGLDDRRLASIIRSLQEMPGQRLFQYLDDDGKPRPVGSTDVNAYLRDAMGEHFTAKDFRTWAGTLAAAKALAMQPAPPDDRESRRLVTLCIKATAGLLGNTPAVCRSAYIHPAILDTFAAGRLPAIFGEARGEAYEEAILSFLDALAAQAPPPEHSRTCAGRTHTVRDEGPPRRRARRVPIPGAPRTASMNTPDRTH
jgi:DNA topoisomerase-1